MEFILRFSFVDCFSFFQGIARLILTNCLSSNDVEKVSRIALERIKQGPEALAMPGLKLLVTCIYFGKYWSERF